jgi:hypothetical protein
MIGGMIDIQDRSGYYNSVGIIITTAILCFFMVDCLIIANI